MFCDETLDAVEAIAAGELTPSERVGAHLGSCRACASALDKARRVDQLLRVRPSPAAPQQFTSRTMVRVRRARWRSEQMVDVGFNVALGAVALVVLAGVWLLLSQAGFSSVGSGSLGLVSSSLMTLVRRAAPSLPLYGGATLLVITALGLWWWAERDAAL